MTYKFFLTEDGVPKPGLAPTWLSLYALDGTSKLGVAPTIVAIGGGWYAFNVAYKTAPFDVPELLGVIDAGSALCDSDRYVPVTISLRDLALAKLVNKATYDLASGVETIRNDADTADELVMTLSQTAGVESRET